MVVEQAGARNPIIEGIAVPRFIEKMESLGQDPNTTIQTALEITSQNRELQSSANGGIITSENNSIPNIGDEINGSTDPELLARGTVSTVGRSQNHKRTYGANTEIIRGSLGDAQSSKGISNQNLAAGESGWLSARDFPFARTVGSGLDENFLRTIHGIDLKDTDSIGRVLTRELKEKLSETVFKTENGTIISFFHWSPNSFKEFKFGDGALLQLPTYEDTVYRNLTFDDLGGKEAYNEFLGQYIPEKLIIYDQFISCSKKQDGYPVDGEYKVQLVIESKSARDVAGYGNNMESEVIYPLNSAFIVDRIDDSGAYPIIYLQEVSNNGYNTNEEQGDAVRNLQELHSENDNLQGVSEGNTERNINGAFRSQSASSERQRDTLRTGGRQGALLSTKSQEQENKSKSGVTEATPDGAASFLPENGEQGEGKDPNTTIQTALEITSQNRELQSSANGGIITSENNSIPNIGDDTDVGERIYNRSERQGRESGDSASGSGALQADDGRVYGNGESVGLIRSNSQIVRDSFNRRITLEQKESLKTSVVKNDDGTPKAVYHFTENMFFKIFAKGDIGFHFGNILQAQRHGKGKNGRIITVYLDIKNPIRYRSDLMFWSPNNIAFALQIEGILSKEERKIVEDISENEIIKNKDDIYSSQAATELRRILSEKGYDGIVYENMFEGEGESYIAFYPEQVIIIDDGLNNTNQATPDGAASFLPENGEQGDFEGEAVNDTTENENADIGENSGAQDGLSDSPATFGGIDTLKGKHLDKAQQDEIRAVGKKLGRTVIYEDFYSLDKFKGKKRIPDGYIDKDGNIHINFYAKRPIYFIFKHEITHYLKRALPAYGDFMNTVLDSKAFSVWLHNNGYSSIDELKAEIMDTYSEVKGFNETRCYDEILADFVGSRLFGGERAINAELVNALNSKQKKTFFDVIKNIIEYFKSKFSDESKVNAEITRIEKGVHQGL